MLVLIQNYEIFDHLHVGEEDSLNLWKSAKENDIDELAGVYGDANSAKPATIPLEAETIHDHITPNE